MPVGRGVQFVLKISLQICEKLQRFQKCSSKMSFLAEKLKKSKFSSKMASFGVHFTKILSPLKLKGRKKSLAGRTLAMSGLYCGVQKLSFQQMLKLEIILRSYIVGLVVVG